MIEIRPAYTSYEREEYSDACGFECNEKQFVVACFEDGMYKGCSLYSVYENFACVDELGFFGGYCDETARILLIKSTLNVIDLKTGLKDVIYKAKDTALAKRAGFTDDDGVLKVNLVGYFEDSCKKCKGN